MQGQSRRRRLLALQRLLPLKRRKPPPEAVLTLDAVRTTLELVESSADVCPPLKSAVGAVVAVCRLTDRVAASAADAEALAWRAVEILDEIYNSVGARTPGAIPPHLLQWQLHSIVLLTEIRDAMGDIIKTQGRSILRPKHSLSGPCHLTPCRSPTLKT
ncbi:hypothetical protein FB451DRAFT_1303067, partial [Mycena latifolia]